MRQPVRAGRTGMKRIDELITPDVHTVGIAGHVNPDGDCAGSISALSLYLREIQPELKIDVYMEETEKSLYFLKGLKDARREVTEDFRYDLFILADTSDETRIGVARSLFEKALRTACIDHHVSNPGFAMVNHIEPDASSCCEVLVSLMDETLITKDMADALYTGIIHDCGVFQYANTSPSTLRTAAMLVEKGADFSTIIDRTFNQRSYNTGRALGFALERSALSGDGRFVYSYMTPEEMDRYHVKAHDMGIIVSQLRYTEGTEAAVFAYGREPGTYKVSLRSSTDLDVAKAAGHFGGGGHVRAAGCTLAGEPLPVIEQILGVLNDQRSN